MVRNKNFIEKRIQKIAFIFIIPLFLALTGCYSENTSTEKGISLATETDKATHEINQTEINNSDIKLEEVEMEVEMEEVNENKILAKAFKSVRLIKEDSTPDNTSQTNEENEQIIEDMEAIESTEGEIKEVAPSRKPDHVRSVYITASMTASKGYEGIIEQLIKNDGNAVVMDIEIGGGRLAFEPKNEQLKEINPGSSMLNNLEEIVDELHKKGIYVIARQVVFNDPYTSARKPEWKIKYKWGGYFDSRWLDPSRPGVQNYNFMIMEEVANFGFDEIQFDYIRFPATYHPNLDYHFDEEQFEHHEIITDFLRRAKEKADEYNVELGVDVFGAIVWGNVDWKIVGQSVEDIAEWVDVIYPMTYPSHYSPGFHGYYDMYYAPYSIVHDSIARFVEKAGGKAEVRPWIQGFPLKAQNFGTKYIGDQIRAGYDAGGTGFAIWSPGNKYTYSWANMKLIPEKKDTPLDETGQVEEIEEIE